MKKWGAILLAAAVTASLAACGGNSEPAADVADASGSESTPVIETVNRVGDTVETEYYKITLKDAEFADHILVCSGDAFSKAVFTKAEEFFTVSAQPFADENGNALDGVHGFSMKTDSDDTYLYYDVEVQFIGTETRTAVDIDFSPILSYGEYTFDTTYMSFYREVEDDFSWSNFNADFDSISLVRTLGLEIGYFSGTLEPLSRPIEIRGVLQVPRTVAEDAGSDVTLQLAGAEFAV